MNEVQTEERPIGHNVDNAGRVDRIASSPHRITLGLIGDRVGRIDWIHDTRDMEEEER